MHTKSKNPRKQRKRLYTAPLHSRRKALSATLSRDLRKKFQRRTLPVRRGDKVRVMCGKSKGLEGEVVDVNLKNRCVYVDKLTIKKRDGTEVLKPISPSNLVLVEIELGDKRRQAILERKVSKGVIEAELSREREKREREQREKEKKAREKAEKKKEVEKKSTEETKKEEKPSTRRRKTQEKLSEKGINKKVKEDWISEK